MSLMDLYRKTYGAEKTAAAEAKGEDLIADLLGEKGSEEVAKTAAAYEEVGRQLARESFAAEVLNLDPSSEKTAQVIEELLTGKIAAEDEKKDEEKKEDKKDEKKEKEKDEKKDEEKKAAEGADDILVQLGLAAAPKKEAAAVPSEKEAAAKKEALAKQAALNELAIRMAKSAKKGDEKSKAGLMYLKKKAGEGNAQSKEALALALSALKGEEVKVAGQLESYLASKKS